MALMVLTIFWKMECWNTTCVL